MTEPVNPIETTPAETVTAPPDMAATLAAVQAELASMKAEREAEKAQAETAKADAVAAAKAEAEAKLTDAERTKAELADLKIQLANQDAAAKDAARTALLDGLGADPNYRKVFPEGDARDPQVKAKIERFAADNPKLLTRQPGPPQPNVPDVQKLLKGRNPSSLVNTSAMEASYAAMNDILGRI